MKSEKEIRKEAMEFELEYLTKGSLALDDERLLEDMLSDGRCAVGVSASGEVKTRRSCVGTIRLGLIQKLYKQQ